jgi:hypothetical protein
LQQSPDCDYDEPNGGGKPEGFFAAPAEGPFSCGDPRSYARRKVAGLIRANLSDEGGPAILEFELPADLAERIVGKPGELSEGKAFDGGVQSVLSGAKGWKSFVKRGLP